MHSANFSLYRSIFHLHFLPHQVVTPTPANTQFWPRTSTGSARALPAWTSCYGPRSRGCMTSPLYPSRKPPSSPTLELTPLLRSSGKSFEIFWSFLHEGKKCPFLMLQIFQIVLLSDHPELQFTSQSMFKARTHFINFTTVNSCNAIHNSSKLLDARSTDPFAVDTWRRTMSNIGRLLSEIMMMKMTCDQDLKQF